MWLAFSERLLRSLQQSQRFTLGYYVARFQRGVFPQLPRPSIVFSKSEQPDKWGEFQPATCHLPLATRHFPPASHQRFEDVGVQSSVGDDYALVGGESAADAEIEGFAGDVRDFSSSFLHQQPTCGVVP